jgi:hypothetical protein
MEYPMARLTLWQHFTHYNDCPIKAIISIDKNVLHFNRKIGRAFHFIGRLFPCIARFPFRVTVTTPHFVIPSQSFSRCFWFAHRANLPASIEIRRDRLSKVATVCPRASRVPLPSKLGKFAASEMASSGQDMQILGEVQNIEKVQPNVTLQGKPGLLKQQNV